MRNTAWNLFRTNQSTKKIKVRHRLLSKHRRFCEKASKKCFTGQTSFHLSDRVGEIDDLGLLEHHSDIRKNKVRFYYSKSEVSCFSTAAKCLPVRVYPHLFFPPQVEGEITSIFTGFLGFSEYNIFCETDIGETSQM